VSEKVANVIAETSQGSYFLDSNGTVIKELTADDLNFYQNKFPIIKLNSLTTNLTVGNQPLSGRFINYLLELNQRLNQQQIKITSYQAGDIDEIFVYTNLGYYLKFNINTSIDLALQNFSTVLNQKIQKNKVQYIDLRAADRVSYFP